MVKKNTSSVFTVATFCNKTEHMAKLWTLKDLKNLFFAIHVSFEGTVQDMLSHSGKIEGSTRTIDYSTSVPLGYSKCE